MDRRSTRHRNEPPTTEGSWRMIEGENDSFDTSILPVSQATDPFLSQHSPDSALPSQLSSPDSSQGRSQPSQPSVPLGSQDSIRDFQNYQDDDDVILRHPFKPSVPEAQRSRSSGSTLDHGPALRMPVLDHSSHPGPRMRTTKDRAFPSSSRRHVNFGGYDTEPEKQEGTLGSRVANLFLTAIFSAIDILVITLNFVKKPLAFILAIYLSIGALVLSSGLLTDTIATSLAPICRVPGASYLRLPFCQLEPITSLEAVDEDTRGLDVDFRPLIDTQGQLRGVLKQSLETAYLPQELSRSRETLDDLRTMVIQNQFFNHGAMSSRIMDYVKLSRTVGWDIERLNAGIGTAVSSIIQQNRWVMRIIASHDPTIQTPEKEALSQPSLLGAIASWWPFRPFTPLYGTAYEALVEQYIQLASHTILLIKPLIQLAQSIQNDLETGNKILQTLHSLTLASSDKNVNDWEEIAARWWSKLGGNKVQLRLIEKQLALIQSVQEQRSRAVDVLRALSEELFRIEANLKELEKQMVVVAKEGEQALGGAPLSVHIGVIEDGVARLETAKTLIDREAQRRLVWRRRAEHDEVSG